ncbi:hypothetical protein Bbelb_440700 [Branchiostoma belcheri]|nr:hypothetical protein Bbelb_440700 [Branchiostoma belcheri]
MYRAVWDSCQGTNMLITSGLSSGHLKPPGPSPLYPALKDDCSRPEHGHSSEIEMSLNSSDLKTNMRNKRGSDVLTFRYSKRERTTGEGREKVVSYRPDGEIHNRKKCRYLQ